MKKINKVKFFVKDNQANAIYEDFLKDGKNSLVITDDYELGISIGGDGTFLKMVREEGFNSQKLYVGINIGTLGFLQEIDYHRTQDFIGKIQNGDYKIEELNTLKIIVETLAGQKTFSSLNEVVIRRSDLKLFKNDIFIDEELLEHFAGDGLLISSATGSTAYNMSCSGPIVFNTLKAYVLTPLAPLNNKAYHTLCNSLVIPNHQQITLTMPKQDLFLMVDGRNILVQDVMKITIEVPLETIKCLRMNDFHFIKVVHEKMLN